MPKCIFNIRHGCSPVNLLHIFRTPFPKNTPGRLLLLLSPQFSRIVAATLKLCDISMLLAFMVGTRFHVTNIYFTTIWQRCNIMA